MMNYEKLTQREHVLKRTSHYLGSTTLQVDTLWLYNHETNKMEKRIIEYSPALLKIVDEILTNATDHATRDPTLTKIQFHVNQENGEITVENNGHGIPVLIHEKENMPIPELIFGEFLTSSNYDDTKERITGGLHGLGAKLTNVLSKKFQVDIIDSINHLKFSQTFTDNLLNRTKPKITKHNGKGMTKITFVPDYSLFQGVSLPLSKDIMDAFEKRIIDMTATTSKTVKIYYNGNACPSKSFQDYISLYNNEKPVYYEKIKTWDVAIFLSSHFEQVSFVNGINTHKGGKHVDVVVGQVINFVKAHLEKKKICIKPNQIKERLFVFVNAVIKNPSFDSQTKDTCITLPKDFGVMVQLNEKLLEKLLKTDLISDLIEYNNFKQSKELAKSTDGKKKNTVRVPKLEDALWAGTSRSAQTTLILTEGDSAMSWVLKSLSIIGKERYGIFPLKGKVLNVNDATMAQLKSNEEIANLKTILGLVQNKVYTSVQELRYGKILILTDADEDGKHIQGLLINLFHAWWSSLLKLGYITTMKVPIIKASRGNTVKEFFTLQEFEREKHVKWSKIKYYKGLGTYESSDARSLFPRLNELSIQYTLKTEQDNEAIQLAFNKHKTFIEKRKEWLSNYDKDATLALEGKVSTQVPTQVSLYDFVHKSLIHFSNYDNIRSIPCIYDGLKVSQRKILYYMLKSNIVNEIKVAQLSGYVSAETNYHHGETSLQNTIINMAHDFVGSNNINLLEPIGMFGTRYKTGQDHASPRYIFTRLAKTTQDIFHPDDWNLLNFVKDENKLIEPSFFIPTLPMVLINGVQGIGTGFSSFIPCYNPSDILRYIKSYIKNKKSIGELPELVPYYKGFKGNIVSAGDGKWNSIGLFTKNKGTIKIIEIPIGTSVFQYKELLEKMVEQGTLKSAINMTTDAELNGVEFIVELNKQDYELSTEDLIKMLYLSKSLSTNNMYLFNNAGTLIKYKSPNDILWDYCDMRIEYYKKRKDYLLEKLNDKCKIANEKLRFIQGYLNKSIQIVDKTKAELEVQLAQKQFITVDNSYHYLTGMPIHSLSKDQLEKLTYELQNYNQQLDSLKNQTTNDLWLNDLKQFM